MAHESDGICIHISETLINRGKIRFGGLLGMTILFVTRVSEGHAHCVPTRVALFAGAELRCICCCGHFMPPDNPVVCASISGASQE
jgi:hypothetical protein